MRACRRNVTTQAVEYPRNPAFADVFKHLATLKTYSVGRAPKMTDLKRALRLSGMLMQEGIDEDADEQLRLKLTDKLAELRDGYSKTVKGWGNVVREGGEIEVDVTSVAIGAMNVTGRKTTRMLLSEENIDQLFEAAGRMLAAGEGLHRTYWKRFHDKAKPRRMRSWSYSPSCGREKHCPRWRSWPERSSRSYGTRTRAQSLSCPRPRKRGSNNSCSRAARPWSTNGNCRSESWRSPASMCGRTICLPTSKASSQRI